MSFLKKYIDKWSLILASPESCEAIKQVAVSAIVSIMPLFLFFMYDFFVNEAAVRRNYSEYVKNGELYLSSITFLTPMFVIMFELDKFTRKTLIEIKLVMLASIAFILFSTFVYPITLASKRGDIIQITSYVSPIFFCFSCLLCYLLLLHTTNHRPEYKALIDQDAKDFTKLVNAEHGNKNV